MIHNESYYRTKYLAEKMYQSFDNPNSAMPVETELSAKLILYFLVRKAKEEKSYRTFRYKKHSKIDYMFFRDL